MGRPCMITCCPDSPAEAGSFEPRQRAACEDHLLCGPAVDLTTKYLQATLMSKAHSPWEAHALGQAGTK